MQFWGIRGLGIAGEHVSAYHGHHFSVSSVFLRMSISCGVAGTPDGTGGRGVGVLAELRVEGEAELVMMVALVDLDTGSRGVICSYLGRRALEQ